MVVMIDVECAECGRSLGATLTADGIIQVKICERCKETAEEGARCVALDDAWESRAAEIDEARDDAAKYGYDEGYREGYADACFERSDYQDEPTS